MMGLKPLWRDLLNMAFEVLVKRGGQEKAHRSPVIEMQLWKPPGGYLQGDGAPMDSTPNLFRFGHTGHWTNNCFSPHLLPEPCQSCGQAGY